MDKKQTKKLLKAAVLIYIASFLVINWNYVSWAFNYREISGLVSDFFNPYPSIDASAINAYFSTNSVQGATNLAKEIKTNYTDKQNTLEIPKISISVPIIFSTSSSRNSLEKDLDLGVVYYPGSVYPGQVGQVIILGHSAPAGWPKVRYDWVFTDLDKLAPGDVILIDFNNKQYAYTVRQKTIVQKGAEVLQDSLSAANNVLTLISCWPPGKDYQRIVVQALLVNSE